MEMRSGVLATVEISVNIGYGYDIRGEVSGEKGTIELAEANPVVLKTGDSFSGRVPADWRERFIAAYDLEIAEWIKAASAGGATGPSAWDGYAITAVSDAGLEAANSGRGGRGEARRPAGPLRLMFDLDHPFFKPLWRRVVIVAVAHRLGAGRVRRRIARSGGSCSAPSVSTPPTSSSSTSTQGTSHDRPASQAARDRRQGARHHAAEGRLVATSASASTA